MEYIDVTWRHKNQNDPIRLVSEVDDQRLEVRKLEFFASGKVGFASKEGSALGTRLGTVAIPPLQEISADPEFAGVRIDRTSFEELWRRHVRPAT